MKGTLIAKYNWNYSDLDEYVCELSTKELVAKMFATANMCTYELMSYLCEDKDFPYTIEIKIYDPSKNKRITG